MQDQIGNELTAEWTVASFRSLVGSASAVTSHVKSVVIHFSSFGFQGKMLQKEKRNFIAHTPQIEKSSTRMFSVINHKLNKSLDKYYPSQALLIIDKAKINT